VVLSGAIDKLVRFADENPQFGIYGGRTLYPDGSLNPTSCWGRMTIWNSFCRAIGLSSVLKNYEFFNGDSYGAWQRDTVREVEMVSGCFLLMRRSLWEELGGFDLSYFMYGEDADLCLRARALGARCVICPEAEIVHYGGASEPVRADKLVRLLNAKSRLCISYGGRVGGRLLIGTLWIWVLRRFVSDGLLGLLGNEERMKSASAWWEVAKRYAEWNPQSSPARPTRSG
jgi:GT2 family glycosyltransferase